MCGSEVISIHQPQVRWPIYEGPWIYIIADYFSLLGLRVFQQFYNYAFCVIYRVDSTFVLPYSVDRAYDL